MSTEKESITFYFFETSTKETIVKEFSGALKTILQKEAGKEPFSDETHDNIPIGLIYQYSHLSDMVRVSKNYKNAGEFQPYPFPSLTTASNTHKTVYSFNGASGSEDKRRLVTDIIRELNPPAGESYFAFSIEKSLFSVAIRSDITYSMCEIEKLVEIEKHKERKHWVFQETIKAIATDAASCGFDLTENDFDIIYVDMHNKYDSDYKFLLRSKTDNFKNYMAWVSVTFDSTTKIKLGFL